MSSSPNNDSKDFLASICDFVLECRGKGTFLPYTDLETIQNWIIQKGCEEDLIITLSEILPAYYEKFSDRSVPPSLKGVNKKVLSKLKQIAAR